MADNTNIKDASGATVAVASDDVGAGLQAFRHKVVWGPDGTANDADIASGKPLPVQVRAADGTAVDMNSGVKSGGTLRVTLATDQVQLTNALKVDGSGVTQPVSGTFWQATQPVSAAALPLPTGAATETTLAALKALVPAALDGAGRLKIGGSLKPSFTDNVSIIAAQVLARAATLRGTWDLRTAKGGWVLAKFGRGGTTALASIGARLSCRRLLNNGAAGGGHPAGVPDLRSGITAATSTTVGSDSASGQAVLNATLGTGFLADQQICIQDSGGGVTRLEWAYISKVSSNTITLDAPLQYTHTSAQADTIRNQADVFSPIWLDGGALWEVIIDYGQQSTGDSLTVQVLGQSYDYDALGA